MKTLMAGAHSLVIWGRSFTMLTCLNSEGRSSRSQNGIVLARTQQRTEVSGLRPYYCPSVPVHWVWRPFEREIMLLYLFS
jgi:hypothetical protein